ncbi:amino acid adenylation domain-containing protein [Amycolatopsis sp. NPDC005232]|uniref:non-ribosomal peptide synthetase n=1 Tax=Amycolatopsis sp. NPDC005232 TaxID=3157027 RepID=UPI0033BF7E1B
MTAGTTAVFPTSYAQQSLWILGQLVPGTAAYNVPLALRLRGRLDMDALTRSLETVVGRHDTLRTTFDQIDGQTVQVITDEVAVTIETKDLRGREVSAAEVTALLSRDAARPFDLAVGPLLRVSLVRVADDDQTLLLTVSHLVSDMWSLGILVTELSAVYAAELAGVPAGLPALPLQYGDLAVWEAERVTEEFVEDRLGYWRGQLEGAPKLLDLPTDRARPANQSFRGDLEPVSFSPGLSQLASDFAKSSGATPFMVLLAGFKAVLSRYTGSDDVVVGMPASTREVEAESLIGCFINAVPLRTSLAGDPTFAELVDRVRTVTAEGIQHRDLPFGRLVEELRVPRDLSYNPLVQAMFVLQNAPVAAPEFAGLEVVPVHVGRGAAQLDLELHLWSGNDAFEGFIEYNTDLFDAATMRRLWGHLEVLLEAALRRPSSRLSELPMLTGDEIRRQVLAWNATARQVDDVCLHELFTRQARRTPAEFALRWEGGGLTYQELDGRSNAVAQRMRTLGVGRDTVVGICARRSAELVTGILGVLKAGGTYVALDSGYPDERLAFMLTDSSPAVVLAQRDLLTRLPIDPATGEVFGGDGFATTLLCLEDFENTAEPVPSSARVGDLANIIYTSGSTGRPKGVAVPHRGLVNTVVTVSRAYGMTGTDRVLNMSSVSFDVSVFEIFGTLSVGGTLVLPDEDEMKDAAYRLRMIDEFGVTIWVSVPPLLDSLVTELEKRGERREAIRLALNVGDVLPLGLPGRARAVFPNIRHHNMGGPTEVSIFATEYEVVAVDPGWSSVPYGVPTGNMQVLILDEWMRPVPVGVPGQLYHGGAGVTRGYLNRPGLTAQRYVPNPFAGVFTDVSPGARLYASGDLARYGADGVVELLGRMDNQVKIRGFRIELGEIISTLDRIPAVSESIVVAADDGGEKRLVAYYVPAASHDPSIADLREDLKRTLPYYMVPSAFVRLDALPVSPNGKVNRKALPGVGTERPEMASVYTEPRTDVERVVRDIWLEVLPVEQVGVHDHFFELGGQSLHATQVVSLLRENFRVEVPLRAVFDGPTIADQAVVVEEAGRAAAVDVSAAAGTALAVAELSEEDVLKMLSTRGS